VDPGGRTALLEAEIGLRRRLGELAAAEALARAWLEAAGVDGCTRTEALGALADVLFDADPGGASPSASLPVAFGGVGAPTASVCISRPPPRGRPSRRASRPRRIGTFRVTLSTYPRPLLRVRREGVGKRDSRRRRLNQRTATPTAAGNSRAAAPSRRRVQQAVGRGRSWACGA
jgi:hypothetical protein